MRKRRSKAKSKKANFAFVRVRGGRGVVSRRKFSSLVVTLLFFNLLEYSEWPILINLVFFWDFGLLFALYCSLFCCCLSLCFLRFFAHYFAAASLCFLRFFAHYFAAASLCCSLLTSNTASSERDGGYGRHSSRHDHHSQNSRRDSPLPPLLRIFVSALAAVAARAAAGDEHRHRLVVVMRSLGARLGHALSRTGQLLPW